MFPDKNKLQILFLPHDTHIKPKFPNIPNKPIIIHPFNKLTPNLHYLHNHHQFYTHHHLYYNQHPYLPFSHYSLIPPQYLHPPFSPLPIPIHILCFHHPNHLTLKHFLSHSNNHTLNPPKNFFHPLHKLLTSSKNLHNKNTSYPITQ
ncbi:sce7725 family protein, partial [Staphylococcus aureus]|uniref:sce7725 family protein n=1 Tax=Staphylococcus aureus TaxID=1280 RepID=UPI0037D9D823